MTHVLTPVNARKGGLRAEAAGGHQAQQNDERRRRLDGHRHRTGVFGDVPPGAGRAAANGVRQYGGKRPADVMPFSWRTRGKRT